jgi:hypothetical protein
MQIAASPAFPPAWQPLVDAAANELRRLALNEQAKARFCNDPLLRPFLHRIATRYVEPGRYEFESLLGLGTEQLDELHRRGFATREYAHFGEEQFLYVLNRIAEEPIRVYRALVDLLASES